MSAQTQAMPVLFDAPDLGQVPGSTPGASPSTSSQHTPQFRLEPPTPTTSLNDIANAAFATDKSGSAPQHHGGGDDSVMHLFQQAQAIEQGHVQPGQPQHFDPSQMSDYIPHEGLRASPAPYTRHHPYSHSGSSFDDLTESLDGGPARNKRTSYSHASRSSYDSGDGDFIPDASELYVEPPMRGASGGARGGQKSPGRKEPIRLTATGKPSHARRLPPGHIKRPRNAFILFRSHACVNNLVPQELGITDHRHISRIVGNLWKNLPAEEKRIWEEQAEKEKEEHRRAHPDYKYRPVYRREGVVRRRRRKAVDEKEVEEEERKCEVVARVLLEGGEVSEDRVEKELEVQRERDEIEGRVRGPASRSPSRGARQSVMMQQQHFDPSAYGAYPPNFMPYGEPVYHDPYASQRRQNPPRQTAQNIRYDFDAQEDEDDTREASYALPQRSHTMPPYYDENAFYAQQAQQQQQQNGNNGRAAPPQPLSLFHPGDASMNPMSPGTLFRVANDSTIGAGVPATPRTVAMQQHMLSLQQRIGHRSGAAGMRGNDDATLVSPSSQFHPDGGLAFDHAFLDGALGATDPNRASSVDLGHQQRSFSADDVATRRPSAWNPQQYHIEGNDVFLVPGQPGQQQQQQQQCGSNTHNQLDPTVGDLLQSAGGAGGDKEKTGQQGYSALGEIAAGSSGTEAAGSSGGSSSIFPPTPEAGISFQPDADVAYVFLDAKQAQDQALVDSIRAQGFGITIDASADDLAALTNSVMVR